MKLTKNFLTVALLVVTMIFAGCNSEKTSEPANNKNKTTIGVITHLNASEIEYNELMKKLEKSYRPSRANLSVNYKYYNSLNEMILALEAGQIDMISTYKNVADFILQNSDNKEILSSEKKLEDSFGLAVREEDAALRDELNKAIESMTEEGTLKNLYNQYIIEPKKDTKLSAIKMPEIDGATTITVAVTGDLPPFDFVLPDETPAGFNTAVLAEISNRISKNIKIITIDSGARATVLTSKRADIIFWVSVPKDSALVPANIDQPQGVLITEPYYGDSIVHVGIKK